MAIIDSTYEIKVFSDSSKKQKPKKSKFKSVLRIDLGTKETFNTCIVL